MESVAYSRRKTGKKPKIKTKKHHPVDQPTIATPCKRLRCNSKILEQQQ